jgi:hypothetical protein
MSNACKECQCRDCACAGENGACEHPCKSPMMACMAPVTKCKNYVAEVLWKKK